MRELPRDLVTILLTEAKNQRTPPIDYVVAEDGGRMVHRPDPDIAMAELLEEAAAALASERAALAEAMKALEKMRAAAEDALPILERDRQSLVECCSTLRENASGGIEVVPDTLDPDAVDDVAAYDDAISRLRALTTQESEMDDRAACKEENGDEMCDRCDCWKQTRANCS